MKTIRILFKFIFIPGFLLSLWFFLTIIFNSYGSFSILTYSLNPKTDSINTNYQQILKGQKVSGNFRSRENNLGIFSVRFNTFSKINNDVLQFSIKETNQKNFFYQNVYKVDQFQPNDLFTFGMPLIPDSKNKNYSFEIKSLKGIKGDAVAISPISPTFVMKHQFTKHELFTNKMFLLIFVLKKFVNSFTTISFLISSFIYFSPFLIYIFGIINKKKISFLTSFVAILLDIVFINHLITLIPTVILIIGFIYSLYLNKVSSRVCFFLAITSLFLYPFVLLLRFNLIAEGITYWIYYFLLIGTIIEITSWYGLPKMFKK